jgi:hypothetical protein
MPALFQLPRTLPLPLICVLLYSDAHRSSSQINAIEVSPKIPTQKGETATIDVTANVRNGNLEGGRIKVIVKAGGFPVVNIEKQICDFIRCPLKEGVQTISRNFTLPITLPHGEYEVHVAGTSADGRQIACIDATLPIKADAPSLATAPVGIRKIVFDAREQWPNLIEATLDQGKCAGSYAVATISSIEDRIAVADIERARALGVSDDALAAVGPSFRRSSKLSALDVIVNSPYNEQCRGGNATNAFAYIMGEGVASRACLPYGVWDSPPGPVRRCGFDEAPCIAPRPGPDTKPHSCLNGGDYEASKSLISSPVKFYNGTHLHSHTLSSFLSFSLFTLLSRPLALVFPPGHPS